MSVFRPNWVALLSFGMWLALPLAVPALHLVRPPSAANQQLAELQHRFDLEKNPVRRAQFFSKKLGPALISEIADLYRTAPLETANAQVRAYADLVSKLSEDLTQAVPDPERHSAGFKQLEIHLRNALSRLRDVSTSLPFNDREELKKQIGRLERVRDDIFDKLFPRSPRPPKEEPQ